MKSATAVASPKPTRTGEEIEETGPNGEKVRRRADMAHSPTGKARAKMMLRTFHVRATPTTGQGPTFEDEIRDVPGATHAIREMVLKHGLESVEYRFTVTPTDAEPVDAGERGYEATHRQA